MTHLPMKTLKRKKSSVLGFDTVEALRAAIPENEIARIHRMINEALGIEDIGKMLADPDLKLLMDLPVIVEGYLSSDSREKPRLRTITLSTAASLDNTRVQAVLASASRVRQQLNDEKLEELTEEFLGAQPNLAITLEQSPVLYALSKADRRLVV